MIRIKVKLFAAIRDAAGVDAVEVEARTVAEVSRELQTRWPATKGLIDRSRFAVNQAFVPLDTQLNGDDEVAVIPPVSGG